MFGAALIAATLAIAATPASARPVVAVDEDRQLDAYVRARMAEGDRELLAAASAYREAVTLDPDSVEIAARGYRQAVLAGDKALALRAAHGLEAAGTLPRDGTILLLIDALDNRQWDDARALVDRIEKEQNLAFVVPFMRSWISMRDGPYDPPNVGVGEPYAVFAVRYLEEQLLLQRLALEDGTGAVDAYQRAVERGMAMGPAERWLIAAKFDDLGRRDLALDILSPDVSEGADGRALLSQARKLYRKTEITPQTGLAMLMYRLALDLFGHGEDNATLSIARMASFADADNDDVRLAVMRAALAADFPDVVVTESIRISRNSPGWQNSQALRLRGLMAQGEGDLAVSQARQLAASADDPQMWRLLGDVVIRTGDFAAAADAYSKARALTKGDEDPGLLLQLGGALEQAGQWEEARPLLEKVIALAPDSAAALNHLGYALADRKEDLPRAIALLEKANKLRPDEPAFVDSLGWAYHRAGDQAKALPLIQSAVAAEPGNAELNEHLGDILWAMGRHFEARYAWRAALAGLEDENSPLRARVEQKLNDAGIKTPS